MDQTSTFRVSASRDNLSKIQHFVLERAEALGVPDSLRSKLELVVEEVFINIASYAYSEGGGTVEADCALDGRRFRLRFVDHGIPFDPTGQGPPDTHEDVDHRTIGGLGVFLIQKMADEIRYERQEDVNVLTMHFTLPQEASAAQEYDDEEKKLV
ncbi:ATP-binding protein [Salidesulfovibrio brasiliensis]|uniref:ATP-binding protein n=1 Tax=Salidesulfovibrio brasiliensis TaxID=221711 RepID=UPI0006D116E0|nr:ATP-binding protein [Salidesulfovibrio brasiliensis]